MSANVPVPPPPPPPQPKNLTKNVEQTEPKEVELDGALWAAGSWPELQKACYLARVCEIQPPKECQFRLINAQLQAGPTCGLTAISMLLDGAPSADELLKVAQGLHFTNNGELFSANYLYELLKIFLNTNHESNISVQLHKGILDTTAIREHLRKNACLFVPYDPDVNHSPCLKRGQKAHWALVIGFLITDTDEFHVIARHGKARNLEVWPLKSLSDSNANLFEFAQPNGYPDCDFLLPPGGIAGDLGLNERSIIVNGLKQSVFNLKNFNL